MKILVTGAAGFIGSHLCEELVRQGHSVRAFLRYNSQNNWGWLEQSSLKNELEIISGDIRDFDSVSKAVCGVDTVFHLAALISIPYSYKTQNAFVDVNVNGTLNVLQAGLNSKVKRILVTSTSEVYGTGCYIPIDEAHPRQPQSPYSATKIAADAIAESMYRAFELPVVIVRPFNTYGPRQSARAVIPTIITQCLSGAKTIKLGSLFPTRDLVFVKDTVAGFIALSKCQKAVGQNVNIATGKEIAVADLAKKIMNLTGSWAKIVSEDKRSRPKKSEVERLCGCAKKIKSLTGWKPIWDLDSGLAQTVSWFKNPKNLQLYKAGIYNI